MVPKLVEFFCPQSYLIRSVIQRVILHSIFHHSWFIFSLKSDGEVYYQSKPAGYVPTLLIARTEVKPTKLQIFLSFNETN